MLSSIHPLGERGRNNRWAVTAGSFTVGAILAGGAGGALLGILGGLAGSVSHDQAALIATAIAAGGAAMLDLSGVSPPGSSRQVNEHWIGHFRGWIYGGAFGAQLGLGVATFVVSWSVYATIIAAFLAGSAIAGIVIGAVFGLGRSISVLAAGWIDRPTRLSAFHRKMSDLGARVRVASALSVGALGVVFLTAGLA